MSADFEKMASEAKLAHDLRVVLRSQQQAEQRQERSRLVNDAVAAITSDVIPLLEQAIVAFSRHGISTKIMRYFDVKDCMGKDPSIAFRCLGRVDGAQFEGPVAFFSSDGAVIRLAVAKVKNGHAPLESLGSEPRGQSEGLVARGIQTALNGLFVEMEQEPETETASPAFSGKSGDNTGIDFLPAQRLRAAS
jgi:hypothetical protein